jgi:hypothetical protein
MAVTRPLKEGSVTTYQQKVAAGFPDILASEADADLDTIYAAWNGGVATANLIDASVTYAKLAPDAQLWRDTGTTLVPGTSFATRIVAVPGDTTGATVLLGSATSKARIQTSCTGTNAGAAVLLSNRNWLASTQDDATKPSWALLMNPANDQLQVQRSPAGSTVQAPLLVLDSSGRVTLPGVGGQSTALSLGTAAAGNMAFINAFLGGGGGPYLDLQANGNQPVAGKTMWGIRLNTDNDLGGFLRQVANGGAQTNPLQVDGSGNLTIAGATATKASGTTWANPSDPRLKEDVAPYPAGLAEICRLAPITYRLKAQPDGPRCYGFDASAVREVLPECVSTTKMKLDPADEEETEDVLTFDMHPILVALVNAVKELAARVDAR